MPDTSESYRDGLLPDTHTQVCYDTVRAMLLEHLLEPSAPPNVPSPQALALRVRQVFLTFPKGTPSPLVACLCILLEMGQEAFDELVPNPPTPTPTPQEGN